MLKFAEEIRENELPGSVMEIDDKWQEAYGELDFDKSKFPDPKVGNQIGARLTFRCECSYRRAEMEEEEEEEQEEEEEEEACRILLTTSSHSSLLKKQVFKPHCMMWRVKSGAPYTKGMVERLHGMGFKVTLWVMPFIEVGRCRLTLSNPRCNRLEQTA